jgi:hypothetical protein
MTPLLPDLKEFLRLLNEFHVEYLLIGGYAVSYHPEHLKINKRASGRLKDLADLDNLS